MIESLRQPLGQDVWVEPYKPEGLIEAALIQAAGHDVGRVARTLGEGGYLGGGIITQGSIKREDGEQVSVILRKSAPQLSNGSHDKLVHVRFNFDSASLEQVASVLAVSTKWHKTHGEIRQTSLLPFDKEQADRQFGAFAIYRSVRKAVSLARKLQG
jgi:hypothetical protein